MKSPRSVMNAPVGVESKRRIHVALKPGELAAVHKIAKREGRSAAGTTRLLVLAGLKATSAESVADPFNPFKQATAKPVSLHAVSNDHAEPV